MYLLVDYIGYENNGMSHINKKRKLEKETRVWKEQWTEKWAYCSFENKRREISLLRKQAVRCLKSRPRDDILKINIQI